MSLVNGTINHGITLGTSGAYASPLTINTTGYINGAGSAAVYAPSYGSAQATPSWYLLNFGLLKGGGFDAVVDFKTAGKIANVGSIVGKSDGGSYGHGSIGVNLQAGGTLINFGSATIAGGAGYNAPPPPRALIRRMAGKGLMCTVPCWSSTSM